MNSDDLSQLADASEEDVQDLLRELNERDDHSRWMAGDVCVARMAQVEHGQRMNYLGSLASATGYTYAGLRCRWDTSAFFPPEMRRWNHTVTWSHYNLVRRGFEFETACDILERSQIRGWHVEKLRRFLSRYRRLQGKTAKIDVEQEVARVRSGIEKALRGEMSAAARRHLKTAKAEVEKAMKVL